MQTVYKINIEYESEKDKFDLEPELDKEINNLIQRIIYLKIKAKLNKDSYETGN